MVKKPKRVETPEDVVGELANGELFTTRPSLAAFLTDPTYDDGSPRVVPTLMLFAESGRWQLWLHDREEERSAWAGGSSLDEALDALDEGLREDALSWRTDKGKRRKQ